MKLDPYKNKERYEKWKEEAKFEGIKGINKFNSDLIMQYVEDMEKGLNIARNSIKGTRSFTRLNTLRIRMAFITKMLEARNIKKLIEVKEKQIHDLFYDMRTGKIKRKDGKPYTSVADYVKVFKAFWHWLQKTNKKRGKEIKDITEDLDTQYNKPKFVYFTKEELEKIMPYFSQDEQTMMLFMFDTGIRAPTELMNVKVSDLLNDYKELNIREETSKTFGRRIKLMLCKEPLKEYIKRNELKDDDFLFKISPPMFNNKLKKVGKKVLKKEGLTMYDFRHSSACYYLLRYKDIKGMLWRFGWKTMDMIYYYTEFLGMKDTITEEDMLVEMDKTKLEQLEKRVAMFEDILRTLCPKDKMLIYHLEPKPFKHKVIIKKNEIKT